jgi:hypothetical protein
LGEYRRDSNVVWHREQLHEKPRMDITAQGRLSQIQVAIPLRYVSLTQPHMQAAPGSATRAATLMSNH